MLNLKSCLFFIFAVILISGCSSSRKTFYIIPQEFQKPELKNEFISEYSPFIKERKIFLDPGHGGIDRKNRGYQNLAIEADVNLRVALYLRNFLLQAGADVQMSRTKDTTVDLKDRSKLANESNSDIFISIHHNATANGNDNWTDYTSTYFHAQKGDYEYEPCSHDIAKYIQRDLAYAMRNSNGPYSFDGTVSDYNVYPDEGFSVLRETNIPAVLVECGFHTSTFEENRLIIDEFNKIEAWGIFRGICRYFSNGVPKITYLNQVDSFNDDKQFLSFLVQDTSGIDSGAFKVMIDSLNITSYNFDTKNDILSIDLESLLDGDHILRIIAANKNGIHSFPYQIKINIKKENLQEN